MEQDLSNRVDAVVNDRHLPHKRKVEKLYGLYDYARAEQRAATESDMIDDDGLNNSLRVIELALDDLGAPPPTEKEMRAAASL